MKEKLSKGLEKLSQTIVKMRYFIILCVLAITVLFAFQFPKVRINSDITSSLPKNDEAVRLMDEIGEKYGGSSNSVLIVESDNVYSANTIEEIKQITDSLLYIPQIFSVTSVTNIINIRSNEDGMEVGKLVDEYNLPKTSNDFNELKNRIDENELYKGVLISNNGKYATVAFTLVEGANQDSLAQVIKEKINKMNLKSKVHFTGVLFLMKDVQKIIVKDLKTLLPITTIIIILILFIGFRNFRGVVLPLLTVAIAIIWTVGLMAMLGIELTVVSDTIPVILLALGTAYTIHVLNRLNEEYDIENKLKSLTKSLAYIMVPVFLAYITTAFGFLSFVYGSYLLMIRDFGIFTAVGITFAFILSLTFTPAFISIFSTFGKINKKDENKLVSKVLEPLSNYVSKHPFIITFTWLTITIIFSFGISKIIRKVDVVSYFKKDSSTYIAQQLVDQQLGGVSPFYIVFKGDVQNPDFLKAMYNTEKYLRDSVKYVNYTISVADLVAQMNNAMGEGKKIPNERNKIEQLWMLLEGQEIMPQIVSSDLDEGLIQGRFASLDSRDTRKFIENVNNYLKTNKFENIEVSFSGMPLIYRQIDINLINSQISSMAIAFVLMLLIVSLMLFSVKYGVLSIIPLILTNIIAWGFMGFVGIPLDIATVLVASVTLGVGIDYAVHILSHFKNYYEQTNDFFSSINQTIKVSGNAIIINMFAVAFGFLVFMFSNLVPLQNFGCIMAICMFVSGLSAILLLPSLLVIFNKIKTLKK